ncbi:selenocysteine insertion sequence-binding protein 2-like [Neodiprion virginianus]|uniref:selenocysteine insertion sequence-binding protein 2-like n=1 Tax=Neodiprion virginianus TaxID=2961670 RepID=UPI001EE7148E|nr:selenocysteine insertion sequence-binding protein 2-like [Neodiprion virginianus]
MSTTSTTENWWRCSVSSSSEQPDIRGDPAWLEFPTIASRTRCSRIYLREQARIVDRTNVLDDEGFPRLGQRIQKRKLTESQASGDDATAELGHRLRDLDIHDEERNGRKSSKRPRSIICIDLKKSVERQRSLSESQTSRMTPAKLQRLKLNLSLAIRNPLDSDQVVSCKRGKQRETPRVARLSNLKRVILRERELKRQANLERRKGFDAEKMGAMAKDVSEIDFNRLKINAESSSTPGMRLFLYERREPRSLQLDDQPESSKGDVSGTLENLALQREDDAEPLAEVSPEDRDEPIDINVLTKTSCLKICDETGEMVEVFVESKMPPPSLEKNLSATPKDLPAEPKHSRNFREYCTNNLTPGLNASMELFLAEVYRLQRRMYERDEVKGRSKRRFYAGFKQVIKYVELKKIRFVVIAPDLEGIHGYPGGLLQLVGKLITACKLHEVVFCFALNKRKLDYYTHRKRSVCSCVGVSNYSGIEEIFENVLTELIQARNSYGKVNVPGDQGEALNPAKKDCEHMLLSARINLLFKSLAVVT